MAVANNNIQDMKTKSKPKPFSVQDMQKLAKKLNKLKDIPLLNGKYVIQMHEAFLETQIQKFLLDFQEAALILKADQVSLVDMRNGLLLYQILLIKHFTNSGLDHLVMNKIDDVVKLLGIAEDLINIGVFQEIIEHFPQAELDKIDQFTKKLDSEEKAANEVL